MQSVTRKLFSQRTRVQKEGLTVIIFKKIVLSLDIVVTPVHTTSNMAVVGQVSSFIFENYALILERSSYQRGLVVGHLTRPPCHNSIMQYIWRIEYWLIDKTMRKRTTISNSIGGRGRRKKIVYLLILIVINRFGSNTVLIFWPNHSWKRIRRINTSKVTLIWIKIENYLRRYIVFDYNFFYVIGTSVHITYTWAYITSLMIYRRQNTLVYLSSTS